VSVGTVDRGDGGTPNFWDLRRDCRGWAADALEMPSPLMAQALHGGDEDGGRRGAADCGVTISKYSPRRDRNRAGRVHDVVARGRRPICWEMTLLVPWAIIAARSAVNTKGAAVRGFGARLEEGFGRACHPSAVARRSRVLTGFRSRVTPTTMESRRGEDPGDLSRRMMAMIPKWKEMMTTVGGAALFFAVERKRANGARARSCRWCAASDALGSRRSSLRPPWEKMRIDESASQLGPRRWREMP